MTDGNLVTLRAPFQGNWGSQCHGAGKAGGLLFLLNDFQFKLPTKHLNYPGAFLITGVAGWQLKVASAGVLQGGRRG